jgi:hypothetical protein
LRASLMAGRLAPFGARSEGKQSHFISFTAG